MNDLIGKIVVIKRNGADGPQFPLRTNECSFGRKPECDIRIQLPNVSLEHAVVKVDNDKKIKLINLSSCNQTLVNGKPISEVEVQHLDVFTISDRSFRFEFPSPVQKQVKEKIPKTRHRRSSSTGNTPEDNITPKMPTLKGSPRTPPTGGSLKENIHRLRRHSMPLQEEEEALTSAGADKTPFSIVAVNCELQEKNGESVDLVWGKRKSAGEECKTKRSSKRVSFGPVLSPEQFDKELPPATPVRRGATPRRASTASDHTLVQLCSSSKKRRSVIASPQTESITEEAGSPDSSENETPKTQVQHSSKLESSEQGRGTHEINIHELISQQYGTPKGHAQPVPQFDKMILECTEMEDVIPKSPTPEKCTNTSKRAEREMSETVAMEAIPKDASEVRKQFPLNQFTPNAEPNQRRRSSCRLAEKNCVSAKKDRVSQDYATPKECGQSPSHLEEDIVGHTGSNQTASATDTPQTSRRSSMRLARKSPSLLELRSVAVIQSKVIPHSETASLSHSVEENMDEAILDSDDYTSDEEDADSEMAIGKDKPTRLATPLRKEIEEGVKLYEIKKKMVIPFEIEIVNGIRQTKRTMATPPRTDMEEEIKLQESKKTMATPLKKEISEGIRLRETKRRMVTPLQKEIIDGTNLRQTKRKKMPTPLRKDIEEGIKLQATKTKMATPLKKEISEGIRLRETKKRMATPLQKEIIDGTKLRQTKRKKMPTPLRKDIEEGIKLQETKKKMATPLRKEISEGIRLRKTKKRLATPLKREIIDGTSLRQTKRRMATPLKKEITEGITLREIKKKLNTPIRMAIEDDVTLRVTKKKLSTPIQKAIQAKPKLRKTKRTMNSLLQKEIKRCPKLRKTKQTMPLEVQIEIIKGKQLRPTKKSLPTPLKKEIRSAVTLRKTKRCLPTPLQDEIKRGVQLQKAKKSLLTPLRRQLEEGVALKQTGRRSLKRKRTESGTNDNEPKRLKPPPSIALNETDEELDVAPVTRALKTPLRKAIAAGTRLRTTRHRMATPLRKQIHSKHILRAVRRKSTVITVPEKTLTRKPTYAEIVKRPKKTVAEAKRVSRESSCKFRNIAKGSSKVIPSVKISETAVKNPEIARVEGDGVQLKNRRNSPSLARISTPQTPKSAMSTDSQGMPSLPDTGEKAKKNCWMSSLARATNGVKTRGQSLENLEGLSEMFTTPPAVQMPSNNFPGEKHAGNWLFGLAKATIVPRKHGMLVEDLQGVPEMFAVQPSPNTGSDCNRRTSKKSLTSTDEEAMVEIRNAAPLDTLHVEAEEVSPDKSEMHMTESLAPTKTPSLKSSGKDTTHIEIVSPIKSSCTPSLRSGRNQTSQSAVTQRAMIETGEVLKPNKMPSLCNSAEDTLAVQVVTSVQPSRTPSLRSARSLLCIQNSECSDLELEIVQPVAPNRTPSMRSSADAKAVLRKSIGNPTEDPQCPGLRLIKSPTESNSAESVEDFFVPNMFASPKPQPKRYSRKSEGLQGVARLLRTPDAEDESTVESPKLDGIKSMMQPEKSLASPYFFGLKTLMKTPKMCQRYVDPEENFSAELFASPVQDSSQDPAQLAARDRKDKKHSVRVVRPTSSKTKATTAERSGNIVSETSPIATRSKRKAPRHSIEPVPKRVRCTRVTAKQQIEGKPETRSSSKAVQNNTAVKSQKKTPEVKQDMPKPFVFKRTKLYPIIEVQSPLPSFDDAIEITTSSSLIEETETSNEERKTGNAPNIRKQLNAPLRSSRRGNRDKTPAETPVEEFTKKKVAETYLETRRKKNESVIEDSTNTGDSQKAPVQTLEPKGERKSRRATRNTKANENSLNTMAPRIKTRTTRNQRAEIADLEEEVGNCSFIKEAVKNPAPRRNRSLAKTTKEHAQVLGKTKPTRSTGRDETLDEVADLVLENRSTRASARKQANKNTVVENDNLAQSTRGKNSGKEEVKELKKEVTTKKMKQPPGARSIIRTRGNSARKAEGDDASLEVKKEVQPHNSSKKPRTRLISKELKRSTTNGSKETMSTRSRKAVEDQVEFTEHLKVGTKRSRQENARTPPPEPKRIRARLQAESGLNMRITRSHSQK